MKLIIGLSGASGVIYGIRLLRVLRSKNIETELIVTQTASEIIKSETDFSVNDVLKLGTTTHDIRNLQSPLASGGSRNQGMVIIPCSMKTLAGIAAGYSDNLLLRAADVTLKENRQLVLVPRETPLNIIHLKNMLKLARAGAIILPAMPAYYNRPKRPGDLVDHVVGKVLDILGIEHDLYKTWK